MVLFEHVTDHRINKYNIELPYDPAVPLLSKYLKELKTGTQIDTCTPAFTAALFTEV